MHIHACACRRLPQRVAHAGVEAVAGEHEAGGERRAVRERHSHAAAAFRASGLRASGLASEVTAAP